MKLLTRDTRYAVRALTWLANHGQEEPSNMVTVDTLAREERIPRNYLRKLLQVLAKNSILESHKGKHGGFTLRQKPEEITLAKISAIFQGTLDNVDCYAQGRVCQRNNICQFRKKMVGIHGLIEREFKKITIESLLKEKVGHQP